MAESDRNARLYSIESRENDERSEGERDRDRILYSTALRRLARVTQVVSPDERQILHNRLTHSLEVAQIGRGLAIRLVRLNNAELVRRVGGIDPYVVEAAALAHDLGHPPFGHVAEEVLDRILKMDDKVPDGFEGNAQSFRIVTKLAAKYPKHPGLNLSRATLAGILKYPWLYKDDRTTSGRKKKWGAYDSEQGDLEWAMQSFLGNEKTRSIESALMDWADDIAYAVNDLEDFVRAGLIPLGNVVEDEAERRAFFEDQLKQYWRKTDEEFNRLVGALDRIILIAPRRFEASRFDRATLKSFTSSLISKYIGSVSLLDNGIGDQSLQIDPDARDEVEVLKGLTWYYVIRRKSLTTLRFGQRALITDLFAILGDASANSEDHSIFPRSFADDLELANSEQERLRVVADVIASMSETQVVEIHQRLTGQSLGSALDEVFIS